MARVPHMRNTNMHVKISAKTEVIHSHKHSQYDYIVHNVQAISSIYHQYGRYWYIGMARVPHMRNTNMHGKISAKTERFVVKGCYYHYSAVSLSNKPKNLTRNHR